MSVKLTEERSSEEIFNFEDVTTMSTFELKIAFTNAYQAIVQYPRLEYNIKLSVHTSLFINVNYEQNHQRIHTNLQNSDPVYHSI